MFLLLALLIGVIAGLRAMTAPAAVAWGAALGWFDVSQTPLAFMGYQWTPWVFTVLAVVELITDQLPTTPSRKVPVQFGARIVMGALSGAVIGAAAACSSEAFSPASSALSSARLAGLRCAASSRPLSARIARQP